MELEAANETPTLEANLPIIPKTIVNIGPLLGLLGTIAGMITSFKAASQAGLSNPTAVLGGISEALTSTATGITLAVVGFVAYNYFANLVRKTIEDVEYYGAELVNTHDRAARLRRRVKIGSGESRIEEPEIVVIPMIDVMMFLLFFFMVASLAMAVQNGLPVTLPKASTGKDQRSQTVTVTLLPDGDVYLNLGKTTIDKLGDGLKAIGVNKNTLVTLNSDEKVPYGSVVAVMDEARKAGVQNFGFATNR